MNFKELCIEDIRLIPILMKSVSFGVQGYDTNNLYISSSGRDKDSRLPLRTTWKVIKPESSLKL